MATQTSRTKADLLDRLPDNSAKTITEERVRDIVESAFSSLGSIRVLDGAAPQVVDIAPALLTAFAADGPSSSDVTPDNTTDDITVTVPGVYLIGFHASFTAPASRVIQLRVRVDAAEQSIGAQHISSGSVSASDMLTLAAGEVVTLYIESDQDTTSVTVVDAALWLKRVG